MILTTIPKSGSNWIRNILDLPKGVVSATADEDEIIEILKAEEIIRGHIYPTPAIVAVAGGHYPIIFLHRDPRDIIISWYHHCQKRSVIQHRFLGFVKRDYDLAPRKMMFLIENLKPFYDGMMQWTKHATHVLKYEDVKIDPGKALAPLCDALGVDLEEALGRVNNRARMFRTGNMGNWQYEWTNEHKAYFEEIWGNEFSAEN